MKNDSLITRRPLLRRVNATAFIVMMTGLCAGPLPAAEPEQVPTATAGMQAATARPSAPADAQRADGAREARTAAPLARRPPGEPRRIPRETQLSQALDLFDTAQRAADLDLAAQAIHDLKALMPEDSLALLRRRAWLEQAQEHWDAAQSLQQKILMRLPDDLQSQLNLALIEVRQGQRAAAAERLRRMKLLHPSSAAVDALMRQIQPRPPAQSQS
ncbi:MAG: hypothetical protein J7603_00435 [Pseudacidovorax sp.]|nr:hypothetical protein [Pseudacidovorax sp.]